jgi:hypothetical protein
MRWSNSDPLRDWTAVPSGLTPVFALPLLEPSCRDRLPVPQYGAPLPFPFRSGGVGYPVEPPFFCAADCELAAAFPDGRWPLRQLSGTIHGATEGAFFGRPFSSISTHGASKS